jgi:hypothetical protein
MTDEQIDTMIKMHRYLIRNEMKMLIHRINGEPNAEELQETINDKEWEDFAKWFKVMKDE